MKQNLIDIFDKHCIETMAGTVLQSQNFMEVINEIHSELAKEPAGWLVKIEPFKDGQLNAENLIVRGPLHKPIIKVLDELPGYILASAIPLDNEDQIQAYKKILTR